MNYFNFLLPLPCIYFIYQLRYFLILNTNFYFLKILNYFTEKNSLKKLKIYKTKNYTYYYYKYDNKEFISFDKNIKINTQMYNKFTSSLKIPNSPDNILTSTIKYIDENNKVYEIDVLNSIQKLCGPFVNQINTKNASLIKEYFISTHNINDKYNLSLEMFISDGNNIVIKL